MKYVITAPHVCTLNIKLALDWLNWWETARLISVYVVIYMQRNLSNKHKFTLTTYIPESSQNQNNPSYLLLALAPLKLPLAYCVTLSPLCRLYWMHWGLFCEGDFFFLRELQWLMVCNASTGWESLEKRCIGSSLWYWTWHKLWLAKNRLKMYLSKKLNSQFLKISFSMTMTRHSTIHP